MTMKTTELIQELARRIYIGGDTPVKVKIGEELYDVVLDLHHGIIEEPDHVTGTQSRLACIIPVVKNGE
jgi:hypothetical protein